MTLSYLSDRTVIDCICGVSGGVVIRRRDRYGLRFNYKLCMSCGHVRTANPLSEQSAQRFYGTSDYRSMYFPGESARDVLLRKTPKPNTESALLKYVSSLNIPRGNVVEWGCGGGWNLVPFRDAGWTVSGFDYDRPYLELGRSELGLDLQEIKVGDATPDLTTPPDVIVLNHVLEHSVDPAILLRRLRQFCGAHTTLVVGVPLLETIKHWHWRDFFHVAHVHYFSVSSFMDTASKASFSIVHSDVSKGLFALRKSDRQVAPVPIRTPVVRSAVLLLKGFIEPKFRLRRMTRHFVASVGLLPLALRLKARIG